MPCTACDKYDVEMQRMWRGVLPFLKESIDKATAEGRKTDARRLRTNYNTIVGKIKEHKRSSDTCPWAQSS